jgi:hypothetical protein
MRTAKVVLCSAVTTALFLCLAGSAMAAPQKATAYGLSVTPSPLISMGFGEDQIHVTVDDEGAWDDTGDESSYSLKVYQIDFNSCLAGNPDNFKSETSGSFTGQQSVQLDVFQSSAGATECAAIHIDSAWGAEYNADVFIPFYGGALPEVRSASVSSPYTDLTVTGKMVPGYLVTDYSAETLLLDGSETCASPVHTNSSNTDHGGTFPLDWDGIPDRTFTVTGLVPHSNYCVKLHATNSFGSAESSWMAVSTGDLTDNQAPTAPTNLTYSDLVGQSLTLHWQGSTDDHGVAGYRVIWSYGMAGGPIGGLVNGLSAGIPISCDSKNNHYNIIAVDAQGNESEPSNQITLDGLTCPAPPSGPGTGGGGAGGGNGSGNDPDDTNPNFDTCVSPIKSQTVSGRANHKKISVTVSGDVADDDQSIDIKAKIKGNTDVSFKVNGKKVSDKKNTITVKKKAATITVSFKIGSSTKTITVKTKISDC